MRSEPVMIAAIALSGCASPITNASFYEDADFVQAIPGAHELAAPTGFASAPEGANDVFVAAVDAAHAYSTAIGALVACGDAVRGEPPEDRTDVLRSWRATTVAFSTDNGVAFGWIEVTIARSPDGSSSFAIAAAPDAGGPYADVAAGSHLPDGSGHLTWDGEAAATAFDLDDVGELTADWLWTGDPSARTATVAQTPRIGAPASWSLSGSTFAWSGDLRVTDDGSAWPGWAEALTTVEGGRADGEVQRDTEVIAWETCWNADGTAVYRGGDAGVTVSGDPAACPTAPDF